MARVTAKVIRKPRTQAVLRDYEGDLRALVGRAANLVRNTAVQSINQGAKSGVIYEKYNPRRTHRASAAGEPPATDTGQLVRSITMSVEGTEGEVVGVIRASAPYAAMLEFGTSNIAPRPYMQPGLESQRRKIEEMFKKGGLIK